MILDQRQTSLAEVMLRFQGLSIGTALCYVMLKDRDGPLKPGNLDWFGGVRRTRVSLWLSFSFFLVRCRFPFEIKFCVLAYLSFVTFGSLNLHFLWLHTFTQFVLSTIFALAFT